MHSLLGPARAMADMKDYNALANVLVRVSPAPGASEHPRKLGLLASPEAPRKAIVAESVREGIELKSI